LFPDSPTNAWFLTPDERVKAVQRIKARPLNELVSALVLHSAQENQTGVENKHFKMEQYVLDAIVIFHDSCTLYISRMIEALTDPKTWLFALFSALNNVPNSLTNQQSLIIASLGFSVLQTTLLSCVPGVIEILTIFTGVRLAARRPNSRAYIGAMYFVPSWFGILLVNLLPWSNQVWACQLRYRAVFNITYHTTLGWTSCWPILGCV
jgi:hypothetical protein